MNKTERYNTITELTVLASNLRRRRDSWKQKANALARELAATRRELEATRTLLHAKSLVFEDLGKIAANIDISAAEAAVYHA